MNLIDTNVILRYLVGDGDNVSEINRLFKRLKKKEESVECLHIVLFQVIFVMQSFYKVDRSKIINIISSLLMIPGFYIKNKSVYLLMFDFWLIIGGDIIDAFLVAVSESENDRKIYSLDKGLDRITKNRILSL
ncbi:MAG: PIN domain-containing protein [Fidelibacterota bacterium]